MSANEHAETLRLLAETWSPLLPNEDDAFAEAIRLLIEHPESVRAWDRLVAERDAALAECERLRAELEAKP